MASEKTKWHNLPWILVIGGAILSPIFTDLYNKVPIYTSFVWIWNQFLGLMNLPLRLWWVVLALLVLSAIYILIVKTFKSTPIDSILEYNADKFGHFIWKWDWKYNKILKSYEIKNLIPLCSQDFCNHQPLEQIGFSDDWDSTGYKCPNCGFEYHIQERPFDIQEFINKKCDNINYQHHL